MTEPKAKPRLTIVDETFAALPPPEQGREQSRETERKVVSKYIGAITSVAKQRWLEEIHYDQALMRTATAEIGEARAQHAAEIDRLKAERIQWVKEAKSHGRFQGISISAIVLVPLAVFGMWGVMTLTRMDVIAAQRVQATPAWQPPAQTEPQGFRP